MKKYLKYWALLLSLDFIGPKNFYKLKKYFGQIEKVFSATKQELQKSGLSKKIIDKFIIAKKNCDINLIPQILDKQKIAVITYNDALYPKLLREITTPPPLLYYKGNIDIINSQCVSIVGTRKMTSYGKSIIEQIVPDIAPYITIVSGLAVGVDSYAHKIALENNGKAIAVLGGGLLRQNIYPKQNLKLYDQIISSGGLIISEFAPNMQTYPINFVIRNRIIAGLSHATLIIEAAQKSGSIITAKYALDFNREICAIPGNITNPYSAGTNFLLKQGAHVICESQDILNLYNITTPNKKITRYKPGNKAEESIINAIRSKNCTIEDLCQICKLPINQVNSILSIFEISGIIIKEGKNIFCK